MDLELLIRKVESILQSGEALPLDILAALVAAGIDLSTFDH